VCIYVFRMILSINNDYFLKQSWRADLCHGEVLCFVWGKNWIFKYYVVEFRLLRVKQVSIMFISRRILQVLLWQKVLYVHFRSNIQCYLITKSAIGHDPEPVPSIWTRHIYLHLNVILPFHSRSFIWPLYESFIYIFSIPFRNKYIVFA
jgi:hypothetical protein